MCFSLISGDFAQILTAKVKGQVYLTLIEFWTSIPLKAYECHLYLLTQPPSFGNTSFPINVIYANESLN